MFKQFKGRLIYKTSPLQKVNLKNGVHVDAYIKSI